MEMIVNNMGQSLAIAGIALLILEVAILGFSTFFLAFLGVSLLVSSGLMYLGVIPEDWISALFANAILTCVFALVLWKPLKKMQEAKGETTIHSDFAELTFTLEADVSPTSTYSYAYSGIEWVLKSEQPLTKGTQVKVVKKDVGVFCIEAC